MANQSYGVDTIIGDGTQIRQDLRVKRVECGALPNAGTTTDAHGIASLDVTKVVRVWGIAQNGTLVIPLPYTDSAAFVAMCELYIDATNVTLITGSDLSAFTGVVYIEYYV